MSFFAELKQRKVIRAAAAYAVVAWVLAQPSELVLSRCPCTPFPLAPIPTYAIRAEGLCPDPHVIVSTFLRVAGGNASIAAEFTNGLVKAAIIPPTR